MRTLRHCQCSVDHTSIAPLSRATATTVPSVVAARAVTAVGCQSMNRARCRAINASDVEGSGCLRFTPVSPGMFFASLSSRAGANVKNFVLATYTPVRLSLGAQVGMDASGCCRSFGNKHSQRDADRLSRKRRRRGFRVCQACKYRMSCGVQPFRRTPLYRQDKSLC